MSRTIKVVEKKSHKKKLDALQIQKYIWLAGHAMTLVFGVIFSITYIFHVLLFFKYRSWKWLYLRVNKSYSIIGGHRWYHSLLRFSPQIIYRLSLIGVFLSCGVTSYQNWFGLNPQWYEMLSAENFQSLMVAGLWFFGRKSIYKLSPFMIISYMHLANWKEETKGSGNKDAITKKNAKILRALAVTEVIIAFALTLDMLLVKDGTSGISLVIYLGIFWLRLNFSTYVQITLLRIMLKFEERVPPKYREQWDFVEKFILMKMEDHKKRRELLARTA